MNMDTIFRVNSNYKEINDSFLSKLSAINSFSVGDLVRFKTEYDMNNVDKHGRVRYVLVDNKDYEGFISNKDLDIVK